MSYSRFGPDSQVYVFETEDGIQCCACRLNDGHSLVARTPVDMLVHLGEHVTAGHKVPDDAIAELENER